MKIKEAYDENIIPKEIVDAIGCTCQYCGSDLLISINLKRITCSNNNCTKLLANSLEYFLKSLGVRDFGPAVCYDIVNEMGLEYSYEIMGLDFEEMPQRYSDEVKFKLWGQVQDAKRQPIHKIIRALGLAGIDKSAEKIFGSISTADDLREFLEFLMFGDTANQEIATILGISPGDRSLAVLMEIINNSELILGAVEMFDIEPVKQASESKVINIAITGGIKGWKNKEQFVEHLNKKYDKVFIKYNTTFNKSIDVLVTDTSDPTSSKYKKAVSNQIPVISSDELEELILTLNEE